MCMIYILLWTAELPRLICDGLECWLAPFHLSVCVLGIIFTVGISMFRIHILRTTRSHPLRDTVTCLLRQKNLEVI